MNENRNGQNIVVEDVVGFFRKIPPFQFLEDAQLLDLARSVSLAYYPGGTAILRQGGPPSEHLLVIKKGGVKVSVRQDGGEEALVDYRGEGDVIGFVSLYAGDRSRTNVTATADTICYLVGKAEFRRLLDADPQIREYFHRTFLRKYLDKTLHEMRTRSVFVGGGERLLFTTPVGELVGDGVITAPAGVAIREAAALMSRHRVSCLVLADPAGVPVGMLTDRDIRDKVVAGGADYEEPVSSVMTAPVVTVEAGDYCFEALLTMMRHSIHHLLILDGGRPRGVITNHDLMILQGTSPLSVAQEIEHQHDIAALAPVSRKVGQVVALLLKEGASAANVTRIVTELNDRVTRRVFEIAERKVGPAPVAWAWLALGSEGRGEQVFRTDQDNALVYDDPADPATAAAASRWAAAFAEFARDALVACGFPPCPGGFMAANPLWCQPLRSWRRYFSDWIQAPVGGGPLNAMIFFDFRVLHGDALLGDRLRDHVVAQVADQRVFLNYVVNQVVANRPPIGFFGSFVVEKSGEHKDLLNLKARGLNPVVDLVRFLALEKGVRETGTRERIDALRAVHADLRDRADELAQAFDFLTLLRAHTQYGQMGAGLPVDNFIDPNKLSNLEKRSIKEAFHLVSQLQDRLVERFKASIL